MSKEEKPQAASADPKPTRNEYGIAGLAPKPRATPSTFRESITAKIPLNFKTN